MASVTGTGVGSGLDVNTIVSSLVALEKRPLTQLQTQAGTLQTRISAFGTLKGQIASLGDVAARLANTASWNPIRADSGDNTAVVATPTSNASPGQHTVAIDRLAQSQVLASGSFATSSAVVGTGTLTIQLGTTAAGTFTPRNGLAAVQVPVGAASQTLAGVRDAINAANAGVTASIVNGTGGARLVLRGADGADSSMRITVADDDGTPTDGSGLSALAWDPAAPAGSGANLSQTQLAQDAKFTVDGVELTSATNTVTGVLDGVTLTLKKVAPAVAVSTSIETTAVRKNINDLVSAYNALNSLLQNQTRADPSASARGVLQGDSAASATLNTLREMLRGAVTGVSGSSSLNALGVVLQRDGSLTLDEARLSTALKDPTQLAKVFSQAQSGSDASSAGFGVRLKAWASSLTSESGALGSRVAGLQRAVQANQKQQDVQQDRLARTEARIRAQYQALDTQMTKLNQQMAQMRSSLRLG